MNTTDSPQSAASPCSINLRRMWLVLTGGEAGCPRTRFFLSMLAVATVVVIAVRFLMGGMMALGLQSGLAALLVLLPALPPMAMSCLAGAFFTDNIGLMFSQWGIWELLFSPTMLPKWAQMAAGPGLPPVYCFICSFVVVISGSIVFGLGFRRLRDAGYSPWHLLAGLWGPLMSGVYYYYDGLILGWLPDQLIYHLGNLWLLWLYCRPTRRHEPLPPETEEETP